MARSFRVAHVGREDSRWSETQRRLSNGRLLKNLCQGDVAADPTRRYYLPVASGVFVAEATNPRKRIVGMLIYEITDEYPPGRSMYIHVLCSRMPGVGVSLMNRARQRAIELGLRWIKLNALDHVIGYYRRIGFRSTDDPRCKEIRAVTRAADGIQHLRFAHANDANSDPSVLRAKAAARRQHINLPQMQLCL